jgi:hypothetical protein
MMESNENKKTRNSSRRLDLLLFTLMNECSGGGGVGTLMSQDRQQC